MAEAKPLRPMEGWYLRDALKKLAEIDAIASNLRYTLADPLTEEDIAAGAEPLSPEQISEDLERISRTIFSFATEELQATGDEWLSATDKVA